MLTCHRSNLAAAVRSVGLIILVLALVGGAGLVSSVGGSTKSSKFTNRSLQGSYALVGTGGAHEAASVGVTRFDGQGRARRRLVLNEPDANGDGRTVLTIPAKGTYQVNRDGTGTAEFRNELPDGTIVPFRFDFVITDAERRGKGRSPLGLALTMVQREAGIAAQLVTFELTRLPR